jgi:hypothetical protein
MTKTWYKKMGNPTWIPKVYASLVGLSNDVRMCSFDESPNRLSASVVEEVSSVNVHMTETSGV